MILVGLGTLLAWYRKKQGDLDANAALAVQIEDLEQQAFDLLAADPWTPLREKLFDLIHKQLHRARDRFEASDYEGVKGLIQEGNRALLSAQQLQAALQPADLRILELEARRAAMRRDLPPGAPAALGAALETIRGQLGEARRSLNMQVESHLGGGPNVVPPNLAGLAEALTAVEQQMIAANIPLPPILPITAPPIIAPPMMHVGDEVRFSIRSPIPHLVWDFGDVPPWWSRLVWRVRFWILGQDQPPPTGSQVVHIYRKPGEYDVIALVSPQDPPIGADKIQIERRPVNRWVQKIIKARSVAAVISLLVAGLVQFLVLYEPNETFGAWPEYPGAFAVGFLITEIGNLGQDTLKRVTGWLGAKGAA